MRSLLTLLVLLTVFLCPCDGKKSHAVPLPFDPTTKHKSEFDGKTITVEGELVDGIDGWRLYWNGSADVSYILKLDEDKEKWCQQAVDSGYENVVFIGVYRDGGHLRPDKLSVVEYDPTCMRMIAAANDFRKLHGLRPLLPLRSLMTTAFQHTRDMAMWKGMQHGGTSGWAGEIIAKGQRSAEAAVGAWINSGGHRAHLLGNYRYCGAGALHNFWTMQFSR